MNRRGFLGAVLAAPFVPPELYVPKRTIFLPPRGGWANGGPLEAGMPYAIGEKGPALFVPSSGEYYLASRHFRVGDILEIEAGTFRKATFRVTRVTNHKSHTMAWEIP